MYIGWLRHSALAERYCNDRDYRMPNQMNPGSRSTLDPRLALAIKEGSLAEIANICDLLETHDPRCVGRISDEIRRVLDQAFGWHAIHSASEARQFVTQTRIGALILSTSGRGYVREAAVYRIEFIPGPFALALVAARLNDWVANVRRAAEAKLSAMSVHLEPRVVSGCIEYLWHFDELGRASSEGRQIVASLVEDAGTIACLRDRVLHNSDDRTVRLVQLLLRSPVLDIPVFGQLLPGLR